MRRYGFLFVGGMLLATAPAVAGEKQAGTLYAPAVYVRDACFVTPVYTLVPTSPAFVNGTSKGKFQYDDQCRVKLKLTKLTDPGTLPISDGLPGTGDEVLCLVHLINTTAGACESMLLRGEVKGNNPAARKVIIKADLAAEGLCTPGAGVDSRAISHVECYEPLPGFTLAAACGPASGTPAPFISDPSQGLCIAASNNIPNPVSPLIAVMGVRH